MKTLITIATLAGFFYLSGCSNELSGTPRLTQQAVPNAPSSLHVTSPLGKHAPPTVYVMNAGGTNGTSSVSVYASGGTSLLRSIDLGGPYSSAAFTVDSTGQLYASIFNGHGRGNLKIYSKRGSKLVAKRHQKERYYDLNVDASLNLFTTCGNRMCEYNADGKITRKIPQVLYPMALDSTGDLAGSICDSRFNGTLCVFSPGHTKPYWIPYAYVSPQAMAFDSTGNLYSVMGGGNGGAEEFSPNGSYPSRVFTGISNPYAIAVDSSDNVYILNQGQITVYPPSGLTPSRTITGVAGCPSLTSCISPIVFDSTGNLYVANSAANSVTVYAPGASSPMRAITSGIHNPIGIALGP